jgi:hypothetical protein
MKRIVRRLPVWLVGVAIAAGGQVIATPGTPAFACGGQTALASDGVALQASRVAGASPVQVSGPGSVKLPAGGRAPFGITVANTGGRFGGSIALEVRTSAPSAFPAMTVERAGSSGSTKTWTSLEEEGTPAARWFAVDGLSFQVGESSTEFRLGVPAEAIGTRLRLTAHVRDTGGTQVGATNFAVTVTEAAVRVRSTFPAELRRGDGYREFDVEVQNPSAGTYHKVRTFLSLTGLTGKPIPREAGHLSSADIRLERRSGGAWRPLVVRPGCDPVFSAALAEPFDLEAGATRTLHLRIRLADAPATKPHPALYYLGAGPVGNVDALGSLSGEILIRPGQITPSPSPDPTPTRSTEAAPPTTAAAAPPTESTTPPMAAPASLPDTGTPIWPLVGGIALLLGGAAAALLAVRLRRRARY